MVVAFEVIEVIEVIVLVSTEVITLIDHLSFNEVV